MAPGRGIGASSSTSARAQSPSPGSAGAPARTSTTDSPEARAWTRPSRTSPACGVSLPGARKVASFIGERGYRSGPSDRMTSLPRAHRLAGFRGHVGHGEPERSRLADQIELEPAREPKRQCGDDDLVVVAEVDGVV